MADEVLYEVEERIAFITLNRPQARNAVNGAVATAMNDIMHRFESDPEVWVAILTGAGNRAFSAGADLKAMASGEGRLIETQEGGFGGFVRFPRTKPVIAAVNGLALAGGTELVLACDMVIAIEEAEFGLPEVSRGIIAAGGGLFRLPLALPRARAIELILTGERIGAREARRLIEHFGVRGFKFHPSLQAFYPNNRSAYVLYEVIAEAGLPAIFHTGHSGIGSGMRGGGGVHLK